MATLDRNKPLDLLSIFKKIRSRKTTSLELGAKRITDDAVTQICNVLLQENPVLDRIDLMRNNITSAGASAVAEVVRTNANIAIVNLSFNKMGDAGAVALARALESNDTVTTLHLAHNNIGDKGAEAIARMLETNRTLQTLHLGDNRIQRNGGLAIMHALSRNDVITMVSLNNNRKVPAQVASRIDSIVHTRVREQRIQSEAIAAAGSPFSSPVRERPLSASTAATGYSKSGVESSRRVVRGVRTPRTQSRSTSERALHGNRARSAPSRPMRSRREDAHELEGDDGYDDGREASRPGHEDSRDVGVADGDYAYGQFENPPPPPAPAPSLSDDEFRQRSQSPSRDGASGGWASQASPEPLPVSHIPVSRHLRDPRTGATLQIDQKGAPLTWRVGVAPQSRSGSASGAPQRSAQHTSEDDFIPAAAGYSTPPGVRRAVARATSSTRESIGQAPSLVGEQLHFTHATEQDGNASRGPSHMQVFVDKATGRKYIHNSVTGVSTWLEDAIRAGTPMRTLGSNNTASNGVATIASHMHMSVTDDRDTTVTPTSPPTSTNLNASSMALSSRSRVGDMSGFTASGPGLVLTTTPRGAIVVAELTPGCGAARAGVIREGDRLVAINGELVPSSTSLRETNRLLEGPDGSLVSVTLRRGATTEQTVMLMRGGRSWLDDWEARIHQVFSLHSKVTQLRAQLVDAEDLLTAERESWNQERESLTSQIEQLGALRDTNEPKVVAAGNKINTESEHHGRESELITLLKEENDSLMQRLNAHEARQRSATSTRPNRSERLKELMRSTSFSPNSSGSEVDSPTVRSVAPGYVLRASADSTFAGTGPSGAAGSTTSYRNSHDLIESEARSQLTNQIEALRKAVEALPANRGNIPTTSMGTTVTQPRGHPAGDSETMSATANLQSSPQQPMQPFAKVFMEAPQPSESSTSAMTPETNASGRGLSHRDGPGQIIDTVSQPARLPEVIHHDSPSHAYGQSVTAAATANTPNLASGTRTAVHAAPSQLEAVSGSARTFYASGAPTDPAATPAASSRYDHAVNNDGVSDPSSGPSPTMPVVPSTLLQSHGRPLTPTIGTQAGTSTVPVTDNLNTTKATSATDTQASAVHVSATSKVPSTSTPFESSTGTVAGAGPGHGASVLSPSGHEEVAAVVDLLEEQRRRWVEGRAKMLKTLDDTLQGRISS